MFELLAWMSGIGTLVQLAQIGTSVFRNVRKAVESRTDSFLNYDLSFLVAYYSDEHTISPGLGYTSVLDWLPSQNSQSVPPHLRLEPSEFALAPGSSEWNRVRAAGYTALHNTGRIPYDEPTVRLLATRMRKGRDVLVLQKARYEHQARSNLILDWQGSHKQSTLRQMLAADYGHALPPLDDARLANSIGVAVLIFFKDDDDQWLPYLVQRTRKVGVYPGGLHCTASGVVRWPVTSKLVSFDGFFTQHVYSELLEEVGLEADDITDLVPAALCREFVRGGKPQLFYVGRTPLSRTDLRDRRRAAIATVAETTGWSEIERDRWYRTEVVLPASSLRSRIRRYKITAEAAAALFYGLRYITARRD